jgi:hypothetical protein
MTAAPDPFFTRNGVRVGLLTSITWSQGMLRFRPHPSPSFGDLVSAGGSDGSFGACLCEARINANGVRLSERERERALEERDQVGE